jgi:hypothetical protein
VAIQVAGLLRPCASVNELTLFVIAKEPGDCGNPRKQSISWIATSRPLLLLLLLMNTRLVITSLAPPGVVIQLDGHAAERLAMTPRGSLPYHGTARRLLELSQ